MDKTKVTEYLADMIAYLARMENKELEDSAKFRYTRYTLEAMLKQVDDGVFD